MSFRVSQCMQKNYIRILYDWTKAGQILPYEGIIQLFCSLIPNPSHILTLKKYHEESYSVIISSPKTLEKK